MGTIVCPTLHAGISQAQSRKLLPVDEGVRDPSFVSFRARLLQALNAHDVPFVLSVLDPAVSNSFGEESGGAARFRTVWSLERPATSRLWTVLSGVLSLGGAFRPDGSFCAPYVFTNFPGDLDAFEYVVVTREDVPVYASASAASRVLGRLSYDIVDAGPDSHVDAGGRGWVRVSTASRVTGYVLATDVRSPIDYRACFKRTSAGWRLTTLIAGD